jgi:hypothetical protein
MLSALATKMQLHRIHQKKNYDKYALRIHSVKNDAEYIFLKSTCFVFKLKRKKQVLALVLIEDLGFLPLVREIQRLSTRSVTLKTSIQNLSCNVKE